MRDTQAWSYCRTCGNERFHDTLSKHAFPWSDPNAPINGNDSWSVLQCAGCHTVSFCREHWVSEEYEIGDDGRSTAIIHRDLYPPSPGRRKPDWGIHTFLAFSPQDYWIMELHDNVYSALALKAHALAAMGIRAMVDFVVTSKAGDRGLFSEKLTRLRTIGLTQLQQVMTSAAFDAGSAAAHRGHKPSEADLNLMLDIAEELLFQFYIEPSQAHDRQRDADRLKANTPARIKTQKPTD